MWKCKICGCMNFRMGIGGYVEVDFNRIGMKKIYETTLEIINEECVECCRCEFNGNYIKDIADWGEENERD